MSLEEGALIEPLNVAVYACKRGDVRYGKTVLVCGAGPIGLLNMMVAKALGATEVVITDINSARLEVLKEAKALFRQFVVCYFSILFSCNLLLYMT